MTCPEYTERGVRRRIKEECKDCSHISEVSTLNRNDVGMCENFESDHYGHVIFIYHPACKQFESVSLAEAQSVTTQKTRKELNRIF